jgi:hypothetical protein
MMRVIQIIVALIAVAQGVMWTVFTAAIWQLGNAFKGAGDGAGAVSSSGGGSVLLIVVIWLLPVSPYLCIAAGSLNFIAGKELRVAYVYSLVVLSITTLVFLITFLPRLELMAVGNIVLGGLWIFSFRGRKKAESNITEASQ